MKAQAQYPLWRVEWTHINGYQAPYRFVEAKTRREATKLAPTQGRLFKNIFVCKNCKAKGKVIEIIECPLGCFHNRPKYGCALNKAQEANNNEK